MVDPTDASTTTTSAALSGWHLAPTSFEVRAVDITSGVDHVEWSLDGARDAERPERLQRAALGERPAPDPHARRRHRRQRLRLDRPHHPHRRRRAGRHDRAADRLADRPGRRDRQGHRRPLGRRRGRVARRRRRPRSPRSPQGQFTISADGAHTVQTRVRDVAGNESGWAPHTVKIDTTAPTDLTDAPDDWVPAAHVEVKATDAVSGMDRVEWQIDSGPWLHGPSGSIVPFTTTGEYQLRDPGPRRGRQRLGAAGRERPGRRGCAHQHDHTAVRPGQQPVRGGRDRHRRRLRRRERPVAGRQRPHRQAIRRPGGDHGQRHAHAQDPGERHRRQRVGLAHRHDHHQRRAGRQRPARRHHDGAASDRLEDGHRSR